MLRTLATAGALLCCFGIAHAEDATTPRPTQLAEPVQVLVDGKPINVDVGHAAPHLVDWNGDGKNDLLVGQFGEGKLRIYLNEGTAAEPKYTTYAYFKADGEDAKVPTG